VFVPAGRISPRQLIRRHDVVIAASSGSRDVVGKAARALTDYEGGFGAFCKVLRPGPAVDPAYFAHFFKTQDYRRRASALAAGININNLRNEHLDEMRIPVPSLPVQQRIAEVLDRAEGLVAMRRAALVQLDVLIEAIFNYMFGDPATNPKQWPIAALGDLFEIARGGSPRPIDAYITDDPDGIKWITISDASGGSKYITATKRRIRRDGAQRSRSVKPGDFLLTNSMSFGRPYIMRTSGCIHDGWLVLSPRQAELDADYLYCLLGSKAIYSEFERRAGGATVKNLNIDLVRRVLIPVAPVARQREFARRVGAVEALKGRHQASLAAHHSLLGGLQFLAFRGEV
jgi:type I restriction enzyme S subunit